jgi:class 3 adenylate cyclase
MECGGSKRCGANHLYMAAALAELNRPRGPTQGGAAEMSTTRRQAAIFPADVAGFSSLMARDEEGTYARVAV